MAFTFNGRSCEYYGLHVEKYPPRQIPKKQLSEYKVPGRSGKVFVPQGGYENVVQTYEVYLAGGSEGFQEKADKIAAWLLTPEEPVELYDSYDPDAFRLGMFVGGTEWANSLNEFGKAKLSFDCGPQRYDYPNTYTSKSTAADGSTGGATIGTGFPKGNGYIDDPKPLINLYPENHADFNVSNEIHFAIENTITGERTTMTLVCTTAASGKSIWIDTQKGIIYLENDVTGERENFEDYFTVTLNGDLQMDFTTQIRFDVQPVLFNMTYEIYARWYKL